MTRQGTQEGAATATRRPTPGPRGQRTRDRLLEAARTLLRAESPLELSAIRVARAAGIAPPSFYVYFEDLKALLLVAAQQNAPAFAALSTMLDDQPWPPADPTLWANRFIARFVETWSRDQHILLYRNFEGDRGDRAFVSARIDGSLPIVDRLADRIAERRPGLPREAAIAEAAILHAMLERVAINDASPTRRLPIRVFRDGLARLLVAAIAG
jgi:AcrR family transcriptional regulator